MADMKVYSLIGIKYDGVLYPFESSDVNPGVEQMLNGGNASISPTIVATMTVKPVVSFTSAALATVLGKFGQAFLIETGKTIILYFAQRGSGSPVYVAGSTCVTPTINEGAVFLKNLTAKQGSPATASYDVYCTYDGTNLPLAIAAGVAAPTDAILAEKFTLGPAKMTTLIETQGVNWDTGYSIEHLSHSGEMYPYIAAASKQEGTVTVDTLDVNVLVTATMIGKEVSTFTLFFQKMSESVGRVAAATEQHISVVFAKAHVIPGQLSGPWRGNANPKITLRPRSDGTNAVAVIDTTAAIA